MITTVSVQCHKCENLFEEPVWRNKQAVAKGRTLAFCSVKCRREHEKESFISLPCYNCGKEVSRCISQTMLPDGGNIFCSRSCGVSSNNRKKRKSRRSKCEIMLEELLRKAFPLLEIISSDKAMLDGYEVDIAMPSIKLGIEWNGAVHFKPIYGQDKLNRIKAIDAKKQELAVAKEINLIVITDLVSNKKTVLEAFDHIYEIVKELTQQ